MRSIQYSFASSIQLITQEQIIHIHGYTPPFSRRAVNSIKIEEQQQDIKNVFCMEGGQGESSYINNSQSQVINKLS
jgi:hypothetical protein